MVSLSVLQSSLSENGTKAAHRRGAEGAEKNNPFQKQNTLNTPTAKAQRAQRKERDSKRETMTFAQGQARGTGTCGASP